MSTRSQVFVKEETEKGSLNQVFNFYHHHDGYLSGVGQEILQALKETANRAETDDVNIFTIFEEQLKAQSVKEGQYEPEHSSKDYHPDVEYVYNVIFGLDNVWVEVSSRRPGDDFQTRIYSLENLEEAIKTEEEEIRQIIEKRRNGQI